MPRKNVEDFEAFEPDDGDWVPSGPNSKPDIIAPKMYGGLIPQFQDNYEALDIQATQVDLQTKADKLVDDIIKVYYKIDEDAPDDIVTYLKQYQQIETMNLKNLLLQVKASEHVLWSLLNRLNATGSVDNGLYKLITETQEKSIALTMQVSNYVRSLPSYIKQLRFELETNIEMVKVEQTQEMIEQKPLDDDPDNFVKRPQKGMRNFLRMVDEMENAMAKEDETVEANINLPNKDAYNTTDTVTDTIIDAEDISADDLTAELLNENNDE